MTISELYQAKAEKLEQLIERQEQALAAIVAIQTRVEAKAKVLVQTDDLTTDEAAIILGVLPRTVRKYAKDNRLNPKTRSAEGRLYFSLNELLRFREELRHWALFYNR